MVVIVHGADIMDRGREVDSYELLGYLYNRITRDCANSEEAATPNPNSDPGHPYTRLGSDV